jgi:phage baseplate assembly protein W
LEDLHRRMQRVISHLDEVRAQVAQTSLDIENRITLRQLRAREESEGSEAA